MREIYTRVDRHTKRDGAVKSYFRIPSTHMKDRGGMHEADSGVTARHFHVRLVNIAMPNWTELSSSPS